MLTSQQKLELFRTSETSPGRATLMMLDMLREEMQAMFADALPTLAEKVLLKHVEKIKGEKGDAGSDGKNGKDGADGVNGSDGITPQKYVDYFTQKEIEQLRSDITPKKGEHYFTDNDVKIIVDLVQARVKPAMDGVTPVAGKDYPSHEQIRKLVEGLMPKQKTVDKLMSLISPILDSKIDSRLRLNKSGKYMHGGGDTVKAGTNITITTGTDGSKTITSTGGGGSGYQAPLTGGLTGTNTWTTAPSVLVIDGVPRQKVQTDGTVMWTGTTTTVLTNAPLPVFDIFASS